jgi:hypothetical protein
MGPVFPETSPWAIIIPLENMSFLFHKKTRKVLNVVWAVVAVLIILSMVLFFAPGLPEFLFGLFSV